MLFDDKKEVTIELLTKMLGTVPYNKDVYAKYILDSDVNNEEVETVTEKEEKGWTGFHIDDNGVFIYEYMLKGFLKSAVETLQEAGKINKVVAYKKWIDRAIQISPRRIYFGLPKPDGTIDPNDPKQTEGPLERPLRTMTPKGERVTVTRSDFVNAGRQLKFNVGLLPNNKGLDWKVIQMAFEEFGQHIGLGQWRGSGGYGRFKMVEMKTA